MRSALATALVAALASAASAQDAVTIVRAGRLIDGVSDTARASQAIVIRGNVIERVGDAASVAIPAGAKVIDLSRETVLPGLIDAHTHLFMQGEDPADVAYDVQLLNHGLAFRTARATVSARRALEQGFTTVRDLGTEGAGYADLGLKQAIEGGYIPGPRIYGATRAISTTGGYDLDLEGYAPEVPVPKGVQIADGPVEARKAAREHLDHGADWVKVYMTHRSWVRSGALVAQPTLTVEELRAVVDEARGWGRKVACHTYGGEGLRRALDGGCDSIEHGIDLDDASIAQMKKQGTWLCPTLAIYYHPPFQGAPPNTPAAEKNRLRVELHERSFRKALRAGVKIAFGSDIGGMPWSQPMAQEFTFLVKFGMTPIQAIKTATSRAAELLDMKGKLGVIAPGAYADLVAVAGDPLVNVEELGRVIFVLKNGKVVRNDVAR
jgi:imidazolonepropionase-like amidohydrolase